MSILDSISGVAGYAPLNVASSLPIRSFVWLDFKLAVAFFVVSPLVLLGLSFFDSRDTVRRSMLGYWQASSLLLITVMLNIAELPVSSSVGATANIFIGCSLVWWKDLNEEAVTQQGFIPALFRSWRAVALGVAAVSGVGQLLFVHCSALPPPPQAHAMLADPVCAASLEPPLLLFDMAQRAGLMPLSAEHLGALGMLGLAFYAAYAAYFAALPLRRCMRSNRTDRGWWSIVDPLISLGIIDEQIPPRTDRRNAISVAVIGASLAATVSFVLELLNV